MRTNLLLFFDIGWVESIVLHAVYLVFGTKERGDDDTFYSTHTVLFHGMMVANYNFNIPRAPLRLFDFSILACLLLTTAILLEK